MIPAVRALARAAMAARPVPLTDVQERAALLTRYDSRYLVPVDVFAEFAAELTDRRRPGGPFAALCINGRRWFRYRSVYFDTPDLRSFHDHQQDRGGRFKIRERLYRDTGERQFEVKLSGDGGRTVKHRRPLRPHDAALGTGQRDFLADVLDRAYGIDAPAELDPSLTTDHQRATFVADGQRITCDVALVGEDARTGRSVRADGGLVLVETKTTAPLSEADRLLHGYGLRAAPFTKYCGALAALRPDLAAHRGQPTARTPFPAR
ncbi:polyphosphate polymerase domain-containing protein [Streptomyces catenulae]|uniref:Polyphosphate polymerase domain-containing protein n=1 Tax=Streptomyces catenulae TaxID=66875 RepID=A0ABV2YXT1_9ACTN|nr:polyphosphate polymerase domain-containing protein [Streptomyces catenulae]